MYILPLISLQPQGYAILNFCRTHHANISKKAYPEIINSFLEILLPPEYSNNDEEEETDLEEGEHLSNLILFWDDIEMDDIDDDVMEEACVGNDYNLQSKGAPTSNNSPSTLKMDTKKTPTATNST